MTIKKSYYDILVYLFKNTNMKARPVAGDKYGVWMCWIPELEEMASMRDEVIYDIDISIGSELHPDMLDRKTKYQWEIAPISNDEHAHICNNIKKIKWVNKK